MKKDPAYRQLGEFLDAKADEYNNAAFIPHDPVSIPHAFSRKQDIEIAGFFAAIFSWGNRTTIINKSKELMQFMDNAPFDFICNHQGPDLQKLLRFKHRTFNATDLFYFVAFLHYHFSHYKSLEDAFIPFGADRVTDMEKALIHFHHRFFSLEEVPLRTGKHIASPQKGSTCKRLNMFLRWMVRRDMRGVDFGIWQRITPAQLICPVDLHVARVARRFGLVTQKQVNWRMAIELTEHLRMFNSLDPVKYDFALFGLGIMEHY